MYADRKYAYSKLQDIKIEGRRGAMTTGNERGDGLIGIRPERNDDVIVTVGPSNRALPMRSNRDQIERKIEKERERMQIIQYEPSSGIYAHFAQPDFRYMLYVRSPHWESYKCSVYWY